MFQIQLSSRIVKSISSYLPSLPPPLAFSSLQELAANRKGIAKVILKKGKTQLFKDGSPMVYSGAVDRIIGRPPPKTGDIVLVADGSEKPIGWGLYNSASMFCIRLMQLEDEALRDASCALDMEKLLERSEGDRCNSISEISSSFNIPHVVISLGFIIQSLAIYAYMFSIRLLCITFASSAAWVEKYRLEIESFIGRISGVNHINWRPSVDILKEEGLDVTGLENFKSCSNVERVQVIENGISYSVSLEGQKTGFYADQRENRRLIYSISSSQRVLDVCCYSGGFALNAAAGGADNVIGVDSSAPALELAKENVQLNNLDPGRILFSKEDASEFMKRAASKNDTWDLVILDPPKLAPRRKVLQTASGMYRSLNSLAMQITKKGGLLMTCSCSGAMTQSGLFLRTLQGAATMAGRRITVVRHAGAACDHPIDPAYPEGAYLTNYLLRVL